MAGEEAVADKATEGPADAGQPDESPQVLDAETVLQEAMDAEPKDEAEGEAAAAAAPEGTEDGEAAVVPGADDTTMAPVDDPVLAAVREQFPGATFETPKEFFDSVANLRTRMSQRDEDARLGRETRESSRQKGAEEEQEKRSFSPPPMPEGMTDELLKPEAERDPAKVEDFNKHNVYVRDKWRGWMEDPNKLLEDLVMPAAERLVGDMLARQQRMTKVEAALKPHEAYIEKHGAEIEGIMRDEGASLTLAVEVSQARRKSHSTGAAKARDADAATLAAGKAGPTHMAPPTKAATGEEPVVLHDPATIVRSVMANPLDV